MYRTRWVVNRNDVLKASGRKKAITPPLRQSYRSSFVKLETERIYFKTKQ